MRQDLNPSDLVQGSMLLVFYTSCPGKELGTPGAHSGKTGHVDMGDLLQDSDYKENPCLG
jgi:hypothetical protein